MNRQVRNFLPGKRYYCCAGAWNSSSNSDDDEGDDDVVEFQEMKDPVMGIPARNQELRSKSKSMT